MGGHDSGEQQAAQILCCPHGSYEWQPIQRGRAIPDNAVQAGQTPRDGVTYVGKWNGEAGKFNEDDGKMWNFWGHSCGGKQGAEIFVTIGAARPSAHGEVAALGFVPLQRDASGFKYTEHMANKSKEEQKTDALRRLKRLVLHGDVPGAERMLARAKQLEVPAEELQRIEA